MTFLHLLLFNFFPFFYIHGNRFPLYIDTARLLPNHLAFMSDSECVWWIYFFLFRFSAYSYIVRLDHLTFTLLVVSVIYQLLCQSFWFTFARKQIAIITIALGGLEVVFVVGLDIDEYNMCSKFMYTAFNIVNIAFFIYSAIPSFFYGVDIQFTHSIIKQTRVG